MVLTHCAQGSLQQWNSWRLVWDGCTFWVVCRLSGRGVLIVFHRLGWEEAHRFNHLAVRLTLGKRSGRFAILHPDGLSTEWLDGRTMASSTMCLFSC